MDLGIKIQIDSSNAREVMNEAVKWLAPISVYEWFQKWCKDHEEEVKIIESKKTNSIPDPIRDVSF